MSRAPGFNRAPDAIVVGGGLLGLATGAALADAGLTVRILSESRPGEASVAAAGLLAPSIEDVSAGRNFAVASRDRYPSYLDWLRERTGIVVPLNRNGIVEVALDEAEAELLRAARDSHEWLDAAAVRAHEPALGHAVGGILYELDGSVDNIILLSALARLANHDPRITFERAAVAAIDASAGVVDTAGGRRFAAGSIVLAAGAWAPRLRGLPRAVPVEPVRGQMLAMRSAALSRAVFGAGIYMVPRQSGLTLVGSTMERVGFDCDTTPEALDGLRLAAGRLCPELTSAERGDSWAGLRPVTPDFLPIIGRDPEYPSLYYACGHSRNGILMGPLTADCMTDLVTGREPDHDLTPFSVTRFLEPIPG